MTIYKFPTFYEFVIKESGDTEQLVVENEVAYILHDFLNVYSYVGCSIR